MVNNLENNLDFDTEISAIEQDLRAIENFAKDSFDHFVDTKSVDEQCQKIGAQLLTPEVLQNLQNPIQKNTNVFITSVVFKDGGHTREIEDWITKIYTDCNNFILLSTPSHISHPEQLQKLSELNIKVIYNDELTSKTARIQWIQKILSEIRAESVFVSPDLGDAIVMAALQPQLTNNLYWNLNLDYGISIGLYIKHITKIIVKRPYLYFYLKEKLGLNNLAYFPFNRPDVIGKRSNYVCQDLDKKIITASCTSAPQKISGKNYPYKFSHIIPQILKITDSTHIHIGAIDCEDLENLYQELDHLNIDHNKFVRIEFVQNVSSALIENDVDVLIQTFPLGGALTTIEAMQAGKMIINHKNYKSYLFNFADFCYEEAFSWSNPDELYDYLKNLNRQEIIRQSQLSRRYFEKNNDSKNLQDLFKNPKLEGLNIDHLSESIHKKYNYALNFFLEYLDKAKANATSQIVEPLPIIEKEEKIEVIIEEIKDDIAEFNPLPNKRGFSAKLRRSIQKRIKTVTQFYKRNAD